MMTENNLADMKRKDPEEAGKQTNKRSNSLRNRFKRQDSDGSGPVLISMLLMCSSLDVKAQLVNPTNGQFNSLEQQLQALAGINPQQLAAQTAANAGLTRGIPPASSSSPEVSPSIVSPLILESLKDAAQAPDASRFNFPPSEDLAGLIGRPTSSAGYQIAGRLPATDYEQYLNPLRGPNAPDPLSPLPDGLVDLEGPGPAPLQDDTRRKLSESSEKKTVTNDPKQKKKRGQRLLLQSPQFQEQLGISPSATEDLIDKYNALRESIINSPNPGPAPQPDSNLPVLPKNAVATSPGVYGVPLPDGSLKAYRNPESVPPTRSLTTGK